MTTATDRLRTWLDLAGIPMTHVEIETEQSAAVKIRLHTHTSTYIIAGYLVGHSYLGGIRLPRPLDPGREWDALDLPSGPFTEQTLGAILRQIARDELQPVEAVA